MLLQWWKKFARALSSAPASKFGYIDLYFGGLELAKGISDLLLQSIEKAPLRYLLMSNNNLGSAGMRFLARAVEANRMIEGVGIWSNHNIGSENDVSLLLNVMNKHPRVSCLHLTECHIGRSDLMMAMIAPALDFLKSVNLNGNSIGSLGVAPSGVTFISNFLAGNAVVEALYLKDNVLNDEDAIKLANSLKSNTNLRLLHIANNQITPVGFSALYHAVVNLRSLDTIYDLNHSCWVDDGEEYFGLSKINTSLDPKRNKLEKLVPFIYAADHTSITHFEDFPLGLMPRVLAFLNETGMYTEISCLRYIYHFLREWSMPLLYTSRAGPELRRSERIRKKMVKQHMRK